MNFDDTVTDLPLIDPEATWLPRADADEPDLDVDGLPGSATRPKLDISGNLW